jgi:hypothetical protein
MKDLNISSIPLQELILEACQNFNIELYIKLPMTVDFRQRNSIKSKITKLELLIPLLSEIIKNNIDT